MKESNTDGRELCPNCRTWSIHKTIAVSEGIALAWCTNCGVPHLASPCPEPPFVGPPVAVRGSSPRQDVTPSRWQWWSGKQPRFRKVGQ